MPDDPQDPPEDPGGPPDKGDGGEQAATKPEPAKKPEKD